LSTLKAFIFLGTIRGGSIPRLVTLAGGPNLRVVYRPGQQGLRVSSITTSISSIMPFIITSIITTIFILITRRGEMKSSSSDRHFCQIYFSGDSSKRLDCAGPFLNQILDDDDEVSFVGRHEINTSRLIIGEAILEAFNFKQLKLQLLSSVHLSCLGFKTIGCNSGVSACSC